MASFRYVSMVEEATERLTRLFRSLKTTGERRERPGKAGKLRVEASLGSRTQPLPPTPTQALTLTPTPPSPTPNPSPNPHSSPLPDAQASHGARSRGGFDADVDLLVCTIERASGVVRRPRARERSPAPSAPSTAPIPPPLPPPLLQLLSPLHSLSHCRSSTNARARRAE